MNSSSGAKDWPAADINRHNAMNPLSQDSLLVIVCAHHDEAKSCIEALRLKRINAIHHFPVFANDTIVLIESGAGANNAAAAVGFIAGQLSRISLAWLNLGVAGHARLELGSLVLAHRICDEHRPEILYPMAGRFKHIEALSLRSYSQPHLDYQGNEAYDMEGWGFFNAAQRFSPLEWIHSLKIISDNADNPIPKQADKATRQKLSQLMRQQQARISEFIETLAQDVSCLREWQQQPNAYAQLLARFHFSESQKQQLQHLLQQWQLLAAAPIDEVIELQQYQSSRQLMQALQQALLQRQRDKYLRDGA